MKSPRIAVAGVAASVAIGVAIASRHAAPIPAAVPGPPATTPMHHPRLYCDFYDVMRKSVVVSFDVDVDRRDPKRPVFLQRYVVEPDDTRADFGTPAMPSPTWAYALDDGTPTTVAANAETRIVLHGLQPDSPGIVWIEAGVRSDRYRNLEGRCRQACLAQ